LDILRQRKKVSMAELFCEKPRESFLCNALLSLSGHTKQDIENTRSLIEEGYQTIKIKVSKNFSYELSAIKEVCREFPKLSLRLDANASWTLQEVEHNLALLFGLNIELIEQPAAVGQMSQVGEQLIPWAADESLQNEEETEALFANKGVSALALKPMVLGGFLRCLTLARRAEEKNIAVYVTHLFDGPIAWSAACALASVLPGKLLACGLAPHPYLPVRPDVSSVYQIQRGEILKRG
jgi:L-alanine-DL-glutamate epimerase-like enolase superfamily enzyme